MKLFTAISPENVYYISNNQRQFALTHGLNNKQIAGVLSNRYRTTKGWKFEYYDGILDTADNKFIRELYY